MQMHEHFKTETNIRHVRVILRGDNYRKGKFGKFFKSKFKILTCVVLLGWLNTMTGISAGGYEQYDEGNMSRGNIYCCHLYSYYLSLAFPCYNQNKTFQTFDICFYNLFWSDFYSLIVLWEVSTRDAVITRLFFQSLCHAFSYMGALMI